MPRVSLRTRVANKFAEANRSGTVPQLAKREQRLAPKLARSPRAGFTPELLQRQIGQLRPVSTPPRPAQHPGGPQQARRIETTHDHPLIPGRVPSRPSGPRQLPRIDATDDHPLLPGRARANAISVHDEPAAAPVHGRPRALTARSELQAWGYESRGGRQVLVGTASLAAGATGLPGAQTIASEAVGRTYDKATSERTERAQIAAANRQQMLDSPGGAQPPFTARSAAAAHTFAGLGSKRRAFENFKMRMRPVSLGGISRADREAALRVSTGMRERFEENLDARPAARAATRVATAAEATAYVAGKVSTVTSAATFTGIAAPVSLPSTAALNTTENVANITAGTANISAAQVLRHGTTSSMMNRARNLFRGSGST